MLLLTYSAFIISLLMSGLVYIILNRVKPQNNSAGLFLSLHICADILWISANAAADLARGSFGLIFWSRISYIGACFFISFYLCFIRVFITDRPLSTKLLGIYLLPGAVLSLAAFSKYFAAKIIFPSHTPAQILPGGLYYIYLVFLLFSLAYSTVSLITAYQKADFQKRKQIIYLETGFIFLFAACALDILMPLKGYWQLYNLAPLLSLGFIILAAMAIFKHKLFDIRIIIQKSLIFSCLLVLTAVLYLLVLYAGLYLLDRDDTNIVYLISSLITTLAGILSMPQLEKYFRKITDRWFYKDSYDYAEAMHELSEILKQNSELALLKTRIAETLKKFLKIECVNLQLAGETDSNNLNRNHFLIIDIRLNEKFIAYLFLGKKNSGDPYRKTDLKLLKTFANQAAVALEKARLFDEVKNHSARLEKKVAERTAQLRKTREKQKQLMIDISHSLQTPLTIMKGCLDNLKRNARKNEEFQTLEKTVDEISKRAYDLLRLARLESQEERFNFHRLNLSSLMEELGEYVAVMCGAQNVKLIHDIHPEIYISGDRQKLEEMVNNLISNSLKNISNQRTIRLTLSTRQDRAEISVKDSGNGIAPEYLPHIFERFYSVPGQKSFGAGMGVGLAINKKIVENHGGNISVESQLGIGTTFFIDIPLYS